MWATRYFTRSYWTAAFWPKVGGVLSLLNIRRTETTSLMPARRSVSLMADRTTEAL